MQIDPVLKQWMMERDAIAKQKQYELNKKRQGLAGSLNPGLLASDGAQRYQQMQQRMQSLTGPMYPDGMQVQNDIKAGPGIRPHYPTPDLKMHRGAVPQMPPQPRNIGLLEDAKNYWGQHGLLGGLTPRGLVGAPPPLSAIQQPTKIYEGKKGDKDFSFAADWVRGEEGTKNNFYWDEKANRGAGAITGGVGHLYPGLGREYEDKPIDSDIVETNFANDLNTHGNDVRDWIGHAEFDVLPQNIQEVLVGLSFNLGPTRLRKFTDTRKAVRNYLRDGAEPIISGLLDSERAKKQLPDRTAREINHINLSEQSTQPIQIADVPKPIAHKPEAAYQQSQNLGIGQRAGGTYGDAEMQRMVALSQQLQNNYNA